MSDQIEAPIKPLTPLQQILRDIEELLKANIEQRAKLERYISALNKAIRAENQ